MGPGADIRGDQRARAEWAERQGAAICLPRGAEASLPGYVSALLDPDLRRQLRRRALPPVQLPSKPEMKDVMTIAAAFGCPFEGDVPLERVQPLLKLRAGRDGALHTQDDVRLSSVPQVAQMLGVFNRQTVAQLTQWIQFSGPIRRIESVGYLGPLKRKLILITQGGQAVWRGEIPIHGQDS